MSNYWKGKKVLVTGGAGFLGRHIVEKLQKLKAIVFVPRSKDFDLREKETCRQVARGQEVVIHLAAKVGGIGYNMKYPGEMFYENIVMGVNMMEEARRAKVKKFIGLGTICAYPKFSPLPFQEKDLWNGYPEETNAPYGLAKKMLLVQAQSYRQQYGFNAIYLLPVNLYGPGDNFEMSSSHVIPALIRKIIEAKKNHFHSITVWGTGHPTREFLFVEDAVDGILMAGEKYNKSEPVNLGAGFEISIKELVEKICDLVEYQGEIIWDTTKPDGQPRRMTDTSRALKEFGFKAKTQFNTGLKKTIEWYKFEHNL